MNYKFITSSHIITYDEKMHILDYYLCSFKRSTDNYEYGIKVVHTFDEVNEKTFLFSANKDEVMKLIYCFAKNTLFPDSVSEVLEDLKIQYKRVA